MYLVQVIRDGIPGATYEVDPPDCYDSAVKLAIQVLKSPVNPNGVLGVNGSDPDQFWQDVDWRLSVDGFYDDIYILCTESFGGGYKCEAEHDGIPCDKPCDYNPEVCLCDDCKAKGGLITCSLCGGYFQENKLEYVATEGDKPRPFCENCIKIDEPN